MSPGRRQKPQNAKRNSRPGASMAANRYSLRHSMPPCALGPSVVKQSHSIPSRTTHLRISQEDIRTFCKTLNIRSSALPCGGTLDRTNAH